MAPRALDARNAELAELLNEYLKRYSNAYPPTDSQRLKQLSAPVGSVALGGDRFSSADDEGRRTLPH